MGAAPLTGPIPGETLIQRWESCRLVAYDDNGNAAGGVWTIGWGTTKYPDGRRVQPGDTCTQAQADEWFRLDLLSHAQAMDALTTDAITIQQAGALNSFVYNCGVAGYRGSTLRRRVNANPNDPSIREAFMRWHFDNGKPVLGLWRRRHSEADHYFNVTTPTPAMP